MQKQKNKTFVLRLMSLFVIVLVISAAAILRDGKLLGHDMCEALATSAAVAVDNDTLEVLPDGAIVVNTRLLAKDVQGYGGPVAQGQLVPIQKKRISILKWRWHLAGWLRIIALM